MTIEDLFNIINTRVKTGKKNSYTNKLLKLGVKYQNLNDKFLGKKLLKMY